MSASQVQTAHVTIVNRQGVHARPAARFVQLASRFEAQVFVLRNGYEVNGKSIMGVMMLAAEQGSVLELRAEGPDAAAAIAALAALVAAGFDEE